jgi:RHS repeat-associated protein
MAGISDKALKTGYAENKYRFDKGAELQNKEFSDGSGLEMYETQLRALDPQLGRWWQIDSKPDEAQSPYASMGNNPISRNDALGDEDEESTSCCLLEILKATVVGLTQHISNQIQQTAEPLRQVIVSAGSTENGYLNTATAGAWSTDPAATLGFSSETNPSATNIGQLGGIFSPNPIHSAPDVQLAPVDGTPSAPSINLPALPSAQVDASGNSGSSNQGSGQGRGSNNRKPDPQATGDHTVSDANGSTTYVKNDRNPTGFQEVKRVDVVGSDHGGVPTPHVHIPGQKLPTPATPQDIPKVDLSKNILPPPTH